jgi:uncharacterized iron-regulated protein
MPITHLPLVVAWLMLASLPPSAAAVGPPPGGGVEAEESRTPDAETRVLDLAALSDMGQLLDGLVSKRVVFVGETHDRFEDHLNQLAVIEGLHNRDKDFAIGMEFFQQPFQAHLDAYIAGEISEKELLRRSEYFERWRFDYRLYRPILRYAREHGIPLVALNLEREITEKVGDGGIESLSPEERARIPSEIEWGDEQYRARVKAAFDRHPMAEEKDFEKFLAVQLLWDEGMAERAARYLQGHPEKSMVILAGTGHLEYGQGIPRRLLRRVPASSAIVLNGTFRAVNPGVADFLVYPPKAELPPSALLGVLLDLESAGEGVGVQGFSETSGAKAAGLEEGDRIVRVGGEPVASYSDIRIALIEGRPGQMMPVEVVREKLIGGVERLSFEVELH